MSLARPTPAAVPLVAPKGVRRGIDGHDADHHFQGVCICSCHDCTRQLPRDRVQCVCPSCDGRKCGARNGWPA